MANNKLCEICGKPNERGGTSKYCCGDCKREADKRNKKLKDKNLCQKIQTN